MSDDGLLTAEQLHGITRKKRPHCQQAWFRQWFGVALPTRNGRLVLSRARFEELQFIRAGLLPATAERARPPVHMIQPAGQDEISRLAVRARKPKAKSAPTPEQAERRRNIVRFHANKRRALKLARIPKWASLDAIQAIYDEAARLTKQTGISHHVDHIIPLQGRLVSGLHVETNLQILPASENLRKYNKHQEQA